MKHASTRSLFAYWDALREERAAPDRADVQPGGMRHVLSDAFILSIEGRATFRLAGSRMCTLFGRDLAGHDFPLLWRGREMAEADHLLQLVTRETSGLVLGILGVNVNGSELPMEMLLLPLRHQGRTDRRVLGALSPATIPSWAGLVPLTELRMRPVRIIEANIRADIAAAVLTKRNPLVLHEGGIA